ncbi:MAG: hypothetical protein JSS75_11530 [Bacteroidetes bacterium]|nr:hypothetical protein [Bacteroidota bacterium]
MSLKIAEQFASSIDACRFNEAGMLLAENCTYRYNEGNYQGRTHVIALYDRNTKFMQQTFDEVSFSSTVEQLQDGTFKLNFIDSIRHKHGRHESRSYEVISIEHGMIVSIEHFDIPGEAEAMRTFYTRMRSMSTP